MNLKNNEPNLKPNATNYYFVTAIYGKKAKPPALLTMKRAALVCALMVLLFSVSAICQTNLTNSTNDEPPVIDLTPILGKEVFLNGRVVSVNGEKFILTDEKTFARLEKAVKTAVAANDYIKNLEAEKKLVDAILQKDAELIAKAKELDTARNETVSALRDALKASKTAEDAERKAKEIAIKEIESLRQKVGFWRRWALGATFAAVLAAWLATR